MTRCKLASATLTLLTVVALVAGTRALVRIAAACDAIDFSRLTDECAGSGGRETVGGGRGTPWDAVEPVRLSPCVIGQRREVPARAGSPSSRNV